MKSCTSSWIRSSPTTRKSITWPSFAGCARFKAWIDASARNLIDIRPYRQPRTTDEPHDGADDSTLGAGTGLGRAVRGHAGGAGGGQSREPALQGGGLDQRAASG